MLTGIIFQLGQWPSPILSAHPFSPFTLTVSITLFMAFVAEYFIRFYYDIPLQSKTSVPVARDAVRIRPKRNWNGKLKALSGGMAVIIVCIYAR